MNKVGKKLLLFLLLTGLLMSADFASASSTDGTIDLTYKYAWGENTGWINFGTANGDVHITDSGLSGYALSETIGWINLENVANDGAGNLSGYAWSENTGWINFAPTNGGVIINSFGEWTGSALGENIGWIIFDCATSACVKTDYLGQSARPQCNNSLDDDNDGLIDYPNDPGCNSLTDDDEIDPSHSSGGSLPPAAYSPPASTREGFSVLINNGNKHTNKQTVILKLNGGPDAKKIIISNFPDFRNAVQIPYQKEIKWNLCKGQDDVCKNLVSDYKFQVFVKFCTQWDKCSKAVSNDIVYQKKVLFIPEVIKKIPEAVKKIPETIKEIPKIFKEINFLKKIKKVSEIIKKIPDILKPKPLEIKPVEIPVEELVSKETPMAMSGQWELLSQKSIKAFVSIPLPREIRKLTEKFPEFGETLKKVGITKITDIEKLKTVKLCLPGLTERTGGISVASLSPQMKQQIPSEIVFAKTSKELIDFNIALSVTEKGEPEQKIATIVGKPLQLVVKPDNPVKSIKGYIVFKRKKISQSTFQSPPLSLRGEAEAISLNSLLGSLVLANPVFAKPQEQPVRVEEKLVLLEFEYTDPDGDGIYTAEIQTPLVEGEYEIITVMDFEDPKLGSKEIRLITVVDPEGYIYTQLPQGKLRITGAIVSIFYLNPETKQYELWPAKEYQQENPQITDDTGKYSFLVPSGMYYLKVEAPKYPTYQSETFQIKEGSGVHMNIELKSKYWYLKIIDWKVIILILFGVLLLYNFYCDKIRERKK